LFSNAVARDLKVNADQDRLKQVLWNLVENAVKYGRDGGEVIVRAEWQPTGQTLISVEDNGPGISEDALPRIFERFYRVDSGRSRDLGGSGLGLAIVRHALQRHDGTLTIDSVEGRGSTFTCHFPAARVVPRPSEFLEAKLSG
jgi:two-component system phosphate regulon sensor histidine kinase PhoR